MSIYRIIAGFLLLLSQAIYAGQTLTDFNIVSDYVFRGKTRTDHSPAVKAGIHYAFDFGFSFGASAGNVGAGDARGMEGIIDLAYNYSFDDIFSILAAGKFFHDPFSSKADTFDYSVGVGITKYLRLTAAYSPAYFASSTNAKYFLAEGTYEVLPSDHLFVDASLGYSKFGNEAWAGNKNYLDYRLTIHRQELMYDLGIFFVTSNRRLYDANRVDEIAKDFGFGASCTIKLKS